MGDRSRRTRKSDRGRNAPLPEFGVRSLDELEALQAEGLAPPRPDRPKGRLLCFDYGTKRIGLALSDYDRLMASPLENYTRESVLADGEYFRQLARREQVVKLIVGLPIHMDGAESRESEAARKFAIWLGELTGLPVLLWDERLTSFAADELMAGAELTRQERKGKRDKLAAMLILQNYLDSGCPDVGL